MEWLVWTGAACTVLGLAGLVFCIVMAWRARRAATSDDDLRQRLQKVVAWNLGALAVSAIGLMMVIVGIFLA